MAAALLLALAWAAASTAAPRPAEEPPAGFAGRQYIDSTGCVFLREGKLWSPRLGRDGAPVCGYPPTPVGRTAGVAPDPSPPLDGMGRIETELVTAIAAGMAPGDWAGALPEAAARESEAAAPAPARVEGSDLGAQVAAAVAAAPAVAGAGARAIPRSALNPSPRLCALLGMSPADQVHVLGADPTGGYCSGLAVPTPPSGPVRAEAAAPRRAVAAAEMPRPARGEAEPRTAVAASAAGGAARKPSAARQLSPTPTPLDNLIPAGTRFLQIGSFADPGAADAALRRVAALGLPVVRSRNGAGTGGRTIMAGPFGTREAVVRAYDRLTRAGFTALVPRR